MNLTSESEVRFIHLIHNYFHYLLYLLRAFGVCLTNFTFLTSSQEIVEEAEARGGLEADPESSDRSCGVSTLRYASARDRKFPSTLAT